MGTPLETTLEVTGDLRASQGTPQDGLSKARIAVATAAVTGQQSDFFEDQSGVTPPVPNQATLAAIQAAIQEVPPNPALRRVVRRGFVTRISPIPKLGVAPGAGRGLVVTHGPFLDILDRPVWIDEFAASRLIAIQRLGAAAPFLYFPDSGFTGTTNTLPLAPGSLWIPASQFVTTAPGDGFVGLRILGGSVKFGRPIVIDGSSPVLVPRFGPISLNVNLDVPAQPTGNGPGADARDAVVSPPTNAAFLFEASGVALNAAAAASLAAFGTQCKLTFSAAPAAFDSVLGRLGFPFAHDAATFPILKSQSTVLQLSGESAISGAQWSVPVTMATPETLGDAIGPGGIALSLAPGLELRWAGRDTRSDCGPCQLLADPGTLTLAGLGAHTTTLPHNVALLEQAPPSTLTLRFPTLFPFRFVADASGSETFGLKTVISAALDHPRTINNERARLEGTGFFALEQTTAGTRLATEASAPEGAPAPVKSYAIRNAFLKASAPSFLAAAGGYQDSAVQTGAIDLEVALSLLVPILPDPYVTNLDFDPAGSPADPLGVMPMRLRWQASQAPAIEVQLPPNATQRTVRLPQTPSPPPDPTDAENLAGLRQLFEAVSPLSNAAISLLDLSTNVSLFGVSFDPSLPPPTTVFTPPVSVEDLFMQAKALNVHVLTLPAVQWESVFTLDQSTPFPSPLTFADCGGFSELAVDMVTLVPVAPLPAIQGFVQAYNFRRPAPAVATRFTLPFGMTAVAVLRQSDSLTSPSPSFFEIAPDFKTEGLAGGEQLSIRAAPNSVAGGESPTLPGAAVQLRNARFGGQPTTATVITAFNAPIDNTFNDNFGPLGHTSRVPVTRIDISGFGESLFSDWKNPADQAAIISKARFDVITGRTAREIVQIRTVLYPYAVRVVRTITVERHNGASVIRRDSGWQAANDGTYVYPNPLQLPGIVTHPGVVRGATGVTNIRDTGQIFTTSDGSQLMAVRFDCAVLMENVVAGAGQDGVPARDHLGYVQITDPTNRGALAPDQYVELLRAAGILGGRIDCIIDIGQSGQRMRVQQIGVAPSANVSGPEFVMAAWGSPVMPDGGQWSFVRKFIAAEAPQPLDPDQGVPLIRQGPASSPQPASPYRFIDPVDLFRADVPVTEYGILHSTGTQRLLFPLPKIEASAPFAITSTRAPVLADPYALATATGIFPRIAVCIPFPDANYQLLIGAGGNLRLQQQAPNFAAPTLKRILRDSNTVRSIAYISDPHPPELDPQPPSLLTVSIDTAAAVPWSVSITRVDLATEVKGREAHRITGTIVSASNIPTQLTDMRFFFGPILDDILESLPFFRANKMPASPITMTNEASLHGGIKLDFAAWLQAGGAEFADQVHDFDLTLLWQIASSESEFDAKFELTLALPNFDFLDPSTRGVFGDQVIVVLGNLELKVIDAGNFYTLQLGGGVGITGHLAAVSLLGFAAITIFLVSGTDTIAVGASLLLRGDASVGPVEIEVNAEAKLFVLHVTCEQANFPTTWVVGQITLSIEVTLGFLLDIEVDVQWEAGFNLDGGPCELTDVVS